MPDTDETKAPMRKKWRSAETAAGATKYSDASHLFEEAWNLWHPNNGRALAAAGHFAKLAGDSPGAQRLFDRTVEELEQQYRATTKAELPSGFSNIRSVDWSPTEQLIAVTGDNDVVLVDAITSREKLRLQGHSGFVDSVAFAPDGKSIASGSWDNTVRLWRISDGSLIRSFEGHEGSVKSVAFAPDGKSIASGSDDNTVRLWRIADGSLIRSLKGHKSKVTSVFFTPNGTHLVSVGSDGIRFWSTRTQALAARLIIPFDHDVSLTLSGNSQYFDVAERDTQWALDEALVCRIGPIALSSELCEERSRVPGLLGKTLANDPVAFDP
jgi:WD40 repeat protein